ncbi:fructosamine kinase family protein [Galbibacter pacificus]|uniref:Fructosamine kinase family protein n=1 Tax=Galbibacter pacificus TaxID=2996052 RepID=A0ABT6FT83_9FLAO|nr:fructosamine kinase family protein [Galbibacter pacificus]MDG3582399.1 fructosamine kinase family protein [Galbibacter pacificus]MDG3586483.1 fructosamine kinase family protein [Galbibacter pacificus]
MIPDVLKTYIQDYLDSGTPVYTALSGGDINEVYKISIDTNNYVVKINSAEKFPEMFEKEAAGLNALRATNSIRIPKVMDYANVGDFLFIMMEYIETGRKKDVFWLDFGHKLAHLHKNPAPYFGFVCDNYIGSLHQQNNKQINAVDFYIEERIEPQIKLATEKGFSFKNIDSFYTNLKSLLPNEAPSLIHGDLWNGNYLVDKHGNPCLIDPAVCYAPREMDISMMHLFGGFDQMLFNAYNEIFPLQPNWEDRLELWQLYYLLVHLNIFGVGYYQSTERILRKYL